MNLDDLALTTLEVSTERAMFAFKLRSVAPAAIVMSAEVIGENDPPMLRQPPEVAHAHILASDH
jgi:hypothetical protein